jgi:hypothetical protein
MSVMPYDPKRCSLFRPANLDELPSNERVNKDFFSDTIAQAIRQQRQNNKTNSADAGLCAELSRLAYFKFENFKSKEEQDKELDGLLNKIDLNLITSFSEEGTQGFVAEDDNSVFLVFRGTEGIDFDKEFKDRSKHHYLALHPLEFFKYCRKSKEWNFREAFIDILTDIFLIQIKSNDEKGSIHGGFLKAFDSSKAQWDSDIQARVKGNGKPIIICGHSLGAALATLAAAYLLTDFPGRIRLYTFGSPLVGNQEFVDSMKGVAHQRHVDCCDIVTRIPSELFYAHHGELRYIFSDAY